jgi:hypothetical protein
MPQDNVDLRNPAFSHIFVRIASSIVSTLNEPQASWHKCREPENKRLTETMVSRIAKKFIVPRREGVTASGLLARSDAT